MKKDSEDWLQVFKLIINLHLAVSAPAATSSDCCRSPSRIIMVKMWSIPTFCLGPPNIGQSSYFLDFKYGDYWCQHEFFATGWFRTQGPLQWRPSPFQQTAKYPFPKPQLHSIQHRPRRSSSYDSLRVGYIMHHASDLIKNLKSHWQSRYLSVFFLVEGSSFQKLSSFK